VVLIDVTGLHRSPLGLKNDWARRHVAAYQQGATPFHPLAEAFLLAAHFEKDFHVKSSEIVLAPWSKILTIQDLRQAKGILETVAGQSVVLSPRDAYLFVLDNRIGGAQFPANRQELARFLRSARHDRPTTAPEFPRSAAAAMDKTTQLVVAVDMADTVDAKLVRRGLEQSKALAGMDVDRDGLAQLLASVQSMRLRVSVTDAIQGEFRIDFAEPVQPHEAGLRAVLVAALKHLGDDLEALSTWKMSLDDKAVRFTKELGENDLLRILEKIQPGVAIAPSPGATAEVDDTAKTTAARTYFQTVTEVVADVRKRSKRVTNYQQTAQAFSTAAERIDRLPTFGVEDDLQKYGSTVSSWLRMLSESLSGVPIQVAALEAGKEVQVSAAPGAVGFVPGRFYGRMSRPGFAYRPPAYYYQGNLGEVQGKQAQVIADDEKNRLAVWRKYDELTEQTRKSLSARFGKDF
jgi:hypothetical protein